MKEKLYYLVAGVVIGISITGVWFLVVEPAKVGPEGAVRQEKQVTRTKEAPNRSELENFLASAAPLAAEFRGIRNAWSVGINYEDYNKATIALLNAYDSVEKVPENSVAKEMMANAQKAIKTHQDAIFWWKAAINFSNDFVMKKEREEERDKTRDEALQYGEAFLTAYNANK